MYALGSVVFLSMDLCADELRETSGRGASRPTDAASDAATESKHEDENEMLKRVPLEVLLPSGAKLSLRTQLEMKPDKILEAVKSLSKV